MSTLLCVRMEPVPDNWERGVVMAAHPDDIEYGMASAVARFTKSGERMSYVLATSGEASIDGLPRSECGPAGCDYAVLFRRFQV